MPALLDTSLVRYLTDDPPHLAEAARAVIREVADLAITGVAIAEVAYVLDSVYRLPRAEIVDSLVEFLVQDNIDTFRLDRAAVIEGLLKCRESRRVVIADALIWAAARTGGSLTVYTFDGRFPTEGIDVLLLSRGDANHGA
ncbi:MAG: PIN domain-containing protein [Dehalococcoidia bacterium]